jgi:hypothetical protein
MVITFIVLGTSRGGILDKCPSSLCSTEIQRSLEAFVSERHTYYLMSQCVI